jgi:acetyl-CoA synthetase
VNPVELKKEMQKMIKTELNPLFKIHDVVLVSALPRTASNKVMRRELRSRYEQQLHK